MTFMAMIDDDEWPEPGWLDEFLAVQKQTGADVLQGSILFVGKRPSTVPDIRRPTGPIANAARRRQSSDHPPSAGGRPRPGSIRLSPDRRRGSRILHASSRGGARFAWADTARAYGDVPESRAALGWVLKRAYSTGNSDMRVLLKHRPGLGLVLRESGKIAGALLLSLPLAVILGFSPNRRLAPLRKLSRAAGKLTAMAGRRYNEYSVVHGE